MSKLSFSSRCMIFLLGAFSMIAMGQGTQPIVDSKDDQIISVIVLARHGVRTPIESETRSGAYNAQPWPAWPASPGVLTEHGVKALTLLSEYYRSRYPSLLQHVSCEVPGIYVEANSTQRTIASANTMLGALAQGCPLKAHFYPEGQRNPLFSPSINSSVDRQRLTDAVLGRMANHPDWFTNAFTAPLSRMHQILSDCHGKDCDQTKPDFRVTFAGNATNESASKGLENPVTVGADFAENFLLEYTEGMPMNQVGWGRVSRSDLDQLMEMNTRYHEFMLTTPYAAQMTASNLAVHIRDTIISAASGRALPGRLGGLRDQFVLLVAHDGTITSLGGLLRLDWILKDQSFNATPPGGALVFEVHRNGKTDARTVQAVFISQTLDQIRNLLPLAGTEQPTIAPIFIPGCSGQAPAFACSIEDFDKVVTSAIDPGLVVPEAK